LKEAARPEPQLLDVEAEGEVAASAVLPGASLAAVDDALLDLSEVRVEGQALGRMVGASASPVTGQRGARNEVARIGCFLLRHYRLCARGPQQSKGESNNH